MPKFGDRIDKWMENQYCREAYFSGEIILFAFDILLELCRNIWLTHSYVFWRVGSVIAIVKYTLTFPSNIRFIWISEYLPSGKIQISLQADVCLSFVP